jgi:hypothetical protein
MRLVSFYRYQIPANSLPNWVWRLAQPRSEHVLIAPRKRVGDCSLDLLERIRAGWIKI